MAVPVEAIERVIDDFQTRKEKISWARELVPDVDRACRIYENVIAELQKVVDDYGTSKP